MFLEHRGNVVFPIVGKVVLLIGADFLGMRENGGLVAFSTDCVLGSVPWVRL